MARRAVILNLPGSDRRLSADRHCFVKKWNFESGVNLIL